MAEHVETRSGAYYDSVSLMLVSRAVQDAPGVQNAFVAMATELNLGLLEGMGLAVPETAGPNDLLIGLRAADDAALEGGLRALESALVALSAATGGAGGIGERPPPRTTGAAAARSAADIALISVPGPHAFSEAVDALDAGLSVMVFSDNVGLEQEIRLKDIAAERNLLVMGPDCGTALIAGVGLGFSNVVEPGRVGLVAASGTGAQQLMCLLDTAGVGVSHCIGVGGRDLSAAVGGRSARQALAALDADPATDLIVVVSKPPDPEVSEMIRSYAATLSTPMQLALLGPGQPDLTATAEAVVHAVGRQVPAWPSWPQLLTHPPRPGVLRGMFSGGTLCDEAMSIAAATLGPIYSNIPLQPEWELPQDLRGNGHAMIDFGDDQLTRGRPHPMIDGSLRLERLAQEAADPQTAVVLLDVILGYGAHPDPAADLAVAIRAARERAADDGRRLDVVVSLCGTAGDPQGLTRQAVAVQEAGAAVFLSNASAARYAVSLISPEVLA